VFKKKNGLKIKSTKIPKGHKKLINTTILYQEMEYVYIMLSVRVRVEYLSSSQMSNVKWVSFVKCCLMCPSSGRVMCVGVKLNILG